jgi:hypothetical protein
MDGYCVSKNGYTIFILCRDSGLRSCNELFKNKFTDLPKYFCCKREKSQVQLATSRFFDETEGLKDEAKCKITL